MNKNMNSDVQDGRDTLWSIAHYLVKDLGDNSACTLQTDVELLSVRLDAIPHPDHWDVGLDASAAAVFNDAQSKAAKYFARTRHYVQGAHAVLISGQVQGTDCSDIVDVAVCSGIG